MTIRDATPADIPQIKECLIDSWVHHAQEEPEVLDEDRMRASNVDAYYQECFNPENKNISIILVAEVDDIFAGFIRGDITSIQPFMKNYDHTMVLDDVYILSQFRNQGIATELFDAIEKRAREKGVKRVEGRIYEFNTASQKTLSKRGYHPRYSQWIKLI